MPVSDEVVARWLRRYEEQLKDDLGKFLNGLEDAESPERVAESFVAAYENTAAIERQELAGVQSVETLREAHDACQALVNGDASTEDVLDVVRDEAMGSPSLQGLRPVLIYVVLVTMVMLGTGDAFGQERVPTADLEPLEVAVSDDLVHSPDDVLDQQIIPYGNNVYSVPQSVLTVLAEQVWSAGEPKGLFTDGSAWLNDVDMTTYTLSLMQNGLSIQSATKAQELVQTEGTILISAQTESLSEEVIIRHEIAHRVIHSLPAEKQEVLKEARDEIIAFFWDNAIQHETPITETTWEELYVNVVFGDQAKSVSEGAWTEVWAYLVQEHAFGEGESATDEVKEDTFFKKLQGLSDEDIDLAQEAILIMREVQKDVAKQMPNHLKH